MKSSSLVMLVLTIAASCRNGVKKTDVKIISTKAQPIGCTPPTTDTGWYSAGTKAPLLAGLEGIDFKITTISKEAQRYFNQGLMLSYGFNHAEAARSFFQATRLDANCAMAYWGLAYVLGPNYNAGMDVGNYERAFEATKQAVSHSGQCNKKEQALIEALTHRYVAQPPSNRGHLDRAFSNAMRQVYNQFPTDPDISALYAESLMDMHPWDMYEKQTKVPRPWTPEIVNILENLIRLHPKHPGGPHLYIHAVEASATPERGLPSANLLMRLVPGSGHLVHMPSHIYIWTGNYHLGALANLQAVQIDSAYITSCHAQGAYPLSYYPHNYHYLSAMATFEGNAELAWTAAKKVQEKTATTVMTQPGWGTLQHYYSIPFFVAVKFAKWDTILATPPIAAALTYPRAIRSYATGMAYLGKHRIADAEKELAKLKTMSSDSALKALTIWDINSTYDIVQIAVYVLTAEIHRYKKEYEQAITAYRQAIIIEDNLNYNEPPDWFFSVRHQLGNALLECGKYADAEKIYLEDLNTWKENGWALFGLHKALQKQGKTAASALVLTRFNKAWKYADHNLTTGPGR